MYLKSISVVISFSKIIFEREHYECKSQMIHVNEGGCMWIGGIRIQTSYIFWEWRGPTQNDVDFHFYPTYNFLDGP